ncbi:MAG: hypothetical protein O2946_10835 [Planctomycetota bacterium]|nr:hypothetical protein [Planctomycetota bacterium]MDA0969341.1 hypothetical protein [Planctomycetota bacterium]
MKYALFLSLAAVVLATGSGCSLIDRLFLLNADGPYAGQPGMPPGAMADADSDDPGVQQVGYLQSCTDGDCVNGGCYGRMCPDGSCQACRQHVGRYGGLARHRLTRGERCALGGSEQIGPAGPPTGGVAYPYYTTRGPRDFLAKCPPSIGP